ncbi:fasciclin domain-containing protein [Mucilaginibacter xinganensis]|uniref:Putative surface protein n=1 Tax=Mucilaginibacter xinganensis TaxID=1234841 RepID=A0A223NZS4_9SPHI|nr:fasciclin domain-containing protein [Mucilaginibacter xinganensis]ASU35280.1 putative surface protein [Mucilaginibacter xinganensis]
MKKSFLIIAAAISIGLVSNNVFAQTQPTQPKPMPTQPAPTQPAPTQPAPTPAQPPQTTTQPPATATPGAKADSVKDIQATLANVADLSTLVGAIKAANLDATLQGAGPFTVFAPGNAAFAALPKAKLDSLMKDPTKLAALVKGHVIAGKFDKAAIIKALTNATKTATLKTVDGQTITIAVVDKKLQLKDAQGNTAEVTSFDTPASNGVIHGINGVLMTK